MSSELEPPKPTKEFHEAYLEIYGKKKKEEAKTALSGLSLSLPSEKTTEKSKEENKQLELDLAALDIPPIKGKDLKIMDMPEVEGSKDDGQKTEKKGFMSRLFSKKAKTETAIPTQESSALDKLDIPPVKLQDTLSVKMQVPESKTLEMMDLPPLKAQTPKQALPALDKLEIESPKQELSEITKKPSVQKTRSIMPSSHDFLAEIKFGARKKQEVPVMPLVTKSQAKKEETVVAKPIFTSEKYPLFDEQAETAFEKTTMKSGARDMQVAFEKKHPHETGGFEFLENIKPLKTPEALKDFKIITEEVETTQEPKIEIPKQLSAASLKKFKREVAAYQAQIKKAKADLKKSESEAKKKQNELQVWLKKQRAQEEKINEKMRKMEQMQRELEEKQRAVAQYEPQLRELEQRQDEMLAKEQDIKARQQDVRETEVRLQAEENAILGHIKKLEADQKLLEKEQDAIQKTVNKLDKERLHISAKTKEFAQIVKKIEDSERALKEKATDLDDREARIRRKEKLIEAEFARIQKLKKTAERLKDVEETYARMRERLRAAYKEYEEKFSNQHYGKKEETTITPMPLVATYQAPLHKEPVLNEGDITNMITATKQMVMDKHYGEANKNINRLMQRYVKIPDNNPRKKEIYYEIVGLKNMLKLDLLE